MSENTALEFANDDAFDGLGELDIAQPELKKARTVSGLQRLTKRKAKEWAGLLGDSGSQIIELKDEKRGGYVNLTLSLVDSKQEGQKDLKFDVIVGDLATIRKRRSAPVPVQDGWWDAIWAMFLRVEAGELSYYKAGTELNKAGISNSGRIAVGVLADWAKGKPSGMGMPPKFLEPAVKALSERSDESKQLLIEAIVAKNDAYTLVKGIEHPGFVKALTALGVY
jgi:hypothetical protein